jgi:hypothetical protein
LLRPADPGYKLQAAQHATVEDDDYQRMIREAEAKRIAAEAAMQSLSQRKPLGSGRTSRASIMGSSASALASPKK